MEEELKRNLSSVRFSGTLRWSDETNDWVVHDSRMDRDDPLGFWLKQLKETKVYITISKM